MRKQYRPGDILFIKIDKLPNIKLKERKGNIILKGELSGHAHRLEGKAKILEEAEKIAIGGFFRDSTISLDRNEVVVHMGTFAAEPKSQVIGYAVVDAPAELTHEEHPTIIIPAGIYEIRRQREYDEEQIRFVED